MMRWQVDMQARSPYTCTCGNRIFLLSRVVSHSQGRERQQKNNRLPDWHGTQEQGIYPPILPSLSFLSSLFFLLFSPPQKKISLPVRQLLRLFRFHPSRSGSGLNRKKRKMMANNSNSNSRQGTSKDDEDTTTPPPPHQVYLYGDQVYTCSGCHTHLAKNDDIISKVIITHCSSFVMPLH